MKHISLDTARALKQAGFPQEGSAFYYINFTPMDSRSFQVDRYNLRSRDSLAYYTPKELQEANLSVIAAPTADELLEVMSDNPDSCLTLRQRYTNPVTWRAIQGGTITSPVCDTPSEALAALWLALRTPVEAVDAQEEAKP